MKSNSAIDRGADFAVDLGAAIKKHPIPAALIGMGVAWMFAGGRATERASQLIQGTGIDRASDTMHDTLKSASRGVRAGFEAVENRIESATETVRDSADAATKYVTRSTSGTGDRISDLRERLSEMFESQPLMLGVVGIAIGAGIAAALPRTKVEMGYLGAASEGFRSRASNYVSEQAAYASDAARELANTVSDEAKKQGLSVEGVKEAASDVAGKASRIVDSAKEGFSDRSR